ncbi:MULTISPECIES: hypothetical protein [unclassified Moorena]|uniref:hypothetical protein n=1 Tax=unclassified Moorena TaxID=2683338 RepID=UPI0013C8E238|nr:MULTISPECIES: hypothetical protein [unclassified Moorena]NEO22120.1 hypothetical protein [Moorena sp. SIO4A5]NEP24313.1 hypothetical protein [Moorena sp. SIO3I6]
MAKRPCYANNLQPSTTFNLQQPSTFNNLQPSTFNNLKQPWPKGHAKRTTFQINYKQLAKNR